MPVVGPDDLRLVDLASRAPGIVGRVAGRDDHLATRARFYSMQNEILLQDIVVPEGLIASLEDVQSPQGHLVQKRFSKGLEISAVAEAARRDRHELAARLEQTDNDREKCGVEIAGLDAKVAQQLAVLRVTPNLVIWRIQDRAVEPVKRGREEPSSERLLRDLDEVSPQDFAVERYPSLLPPSGKPRACHRGLGRDWHRSRRL
jgi:hypothetical protein